MGSTAKKLISPITNLFDPPKPPKLSLPSLPSPPSSPPAAIAEALPTEPPARADSAVQEAAEEVRRRARGGRGRASTIITALSGELPSGSVVRKALLGG